MVAVGAVGVPDDFVPSKLVALATKGQEDRALLHREEVVHGEDVGVAMEQAYPRIR